MAPLILLLFAVKVCVWVFWCDTVKGSKTHLFDQLHTKLMWAVRGNQWRVRVEAVINTFLITVGIVY